MQALLARIAASAAAFDQVGARQVVESAQALGLSRANLRKLSARANDIPGAGESLDRLTGDMVLVSNGSSMFAASQRPVSRDEYARFASARSEEHTSELQSLMRNSYAGLCLKKKRMKNK